MLRRNKRVYASVLAVLVFVSTLGLVACGGDDDSGGDTGSGGQKLSIWYVNPLSSYPAWALSSEVFKKGAGAGDYEATVAGPSEIDIPAMVDDIEQAITSGADGILTCDLDPGTMGSAIERAQDEGIVVVTIGCVDDVSDFAIGTDNATFGETAADLLAEEVGSDAQVGILSTDQTTPNQVEQVKAFEAKLKSDYPEMEVVAWESDKSDAAVAAEKVTAMVSANPGMEAIWCVEGTCPEGAQAGLREAGKKPGDLFVLGIDDAETTISGLEAGWIGATINQCYFIASAPFATDLVRAQIEGNPPAQAFWPVEVDVIRKGDLPYGGCPDSTVPKLPQ